VRDVVVGVVEWMEKAIEKIMELVEPVLEIVETLRSEYLPSFLGGTVSPEEQAEVARFWSRGEFGGAAAGSADNSQTQTVYGGVTMTIIGAPASMFEELMTLMTQG
jgi:hypothetical protein